MTDSDRTCPWDLLGVSPWDDAATIRTAWRALVRRYHPDLAGTDREAAGRKLADINAAFDAISDPEAARRRILELRRAEAARRARSARKARAEKTERATHQPAPDSHQPATRRKPAPRPERHDPAERRRAQAAREAREAFDRALRILDGAHIPRGTPVYL